MGEITASLVEDSLRHALTKGNFTQAEALVMVTEWRARGVEVARVAAGLAAALAGGDVNTGADAGGNAAENNAFFIPAIIVIISAAYATGVGDGDPLEGLAVIGRGDDPLSQAMATATTEAIEWSARHYPDQTLAVLSVLQATNNAIDATITYIDEATGKEVSTRWNRLDQRTREQLIGGGKILSIALPAASVKLIKDLKVARNSGSGVADGLPGGVNAPNAGPRVTIRDHYNHHNEMRTDVISQLEGQGYTVAQKEVSFGGSCGSGRCRPDIIYEAPDGTKGIIEIKTGSADLSISVMAP